MLRISHACEIESVKDVKVDIDGEKRPQDKVLKPKAKSKMPLHKWKSFPNTNKSIRGSRSRKWSKNMYSDILEIDESSPLPTLPEEEEAVGILTMEDVIEELLQVLNGHSQQSHLLWKSCRIQALFTQLKSCGKLY